MGDPGLVHGGGGAYRHRRAALVVEQCGQRARAAGAADQHVDGAARSVGEGARTYDQGRVLAGGGVGQLNGARIGEAVGHGQITAGAGVLNPEGGAGLVDEGPAHRGGVGTPRRIHGQQPARGVDEVGADQS